MAKKEFKILLDKDVHDKVINHKGIDWQKLLEEHVNKILLDVDGNKASSNDIVSDIMNSKELTHLIFGCFGDAGHYIKHISGANTDNLKKYWKREINLSKSSDGQFKARSGFFKLDSEILYILDFPDYQGDKRGGSHTSYLLLINNREVEMIKAINSNPNILCQILKTKFPNYDRSKGELEILSFLEYDPKGYLTI